MPAMASGQLGTSRASVQPDDLAFQLHDLANTAAGVSGLLLLLRSDGCDRALLDLACQAAAYLVEEIAVLRRGVRGDAGQRPVAVSAILDGVRREGVGLAAGAGCGFRCAPPPAVRVVADAGLVHRALVNLVKNAVEACPCDGCVRIEAAVAGSRCRVAVRHPGRMAGAPGANPRPGRGLGLRSVRRIVGLHQGADLGWSSGEADGTSFWIDFPIAAEDAPGRA